MLKKVVPEGPSEVVPVEGIQGGGSRLPNAWVRGSIAACFGGKVRGGMVIFVLFEVLPHGVLLLSGVLGILCGVFVILDRILFCFLSDCRVLSSS